MRSIPINAVFKGNTYSAKYVQGATKFLMSQSRIWETYRRYQNYLP
jgi:hypothetical protein